MVLLSAVCPELSVRIPHCCVCQVSYLGWLQPSQLAEAYAISDLLLFPSEVETFGNVTLEAMASGLPCIVDERCSAHLALQAMPPKCVGAS